MMMKVFPETTRLFIVLLVAVSQLLITFSSKQSYAERSVQKIESNADKKRLSYFKAAGAEKRINTRNTSPDDLIETAKKYLGVPHCMGGTTMKCMDCSGLLVTVFAKYGISLPHNSEEQARYGKIISGMGELKKGDLIFFVRSYKTHLLITHSGIYLGNNKFIHTSSQNGVTITSLNDRWWKERFIFGTRVFEK